MWKEKGNQLLAWITLGIVILLQISFHIIESLFHKVLSILTFLPNMTLEIISIVWYYRLHCNRHYMEYRQAME